MPQGVRRSLHKGLIKEPASSLAAATGVPSRMSDPMEPSWTVSASSFSQLPERDKGTRKKSSPRLPTEEYYLDEASFSNLYERGTTPKYKTSRGSVVKGIRALSIMDTLSQLAGTETLAQPRRHIMCKALPATPGVLATNNESRQKSRGRTPDWIKRIFEYAKRGQLEQLRSSLKDMEATLIRNLSDHHGNNLLHILACQGHEHALAWLCSSLQNSHLQLEGALADENRSGLSPAACAVKYGHLNCVEWLVTNTKIREKLGSKDGERCLLHIATKYNKESVLHWLVSAMRARQIDLDQKDHCGDTPLHFASRTGELEICRILLGNGANVSAKNDLGLKASDMALASGHAAVQHYLNLFEAALSVSGKLSVVQSNFDALREESVELKGYFRDVLSIGKRLAKERDEMCRDVLGHLHKVAGLGAQEKVLSAMNEMAEENRILRERLGMPAIPTSPVDSVKSIIHPSLSNMSDYISRQWKGLVVSGLADMEHRLLMAEEGWRKFSSLSKSESGAHPSEKVALGFLRNQVDQIEEQQRSLASTSFALNCETRSLSSSESSLETLLSLQSGTDNIYSQVIDYKTPDTAHVSNPHPPPANKKQKSKEELKKRMREMALTSESGNASVLEIIEPSTSESEEERADKSKMQSSMPFLATSSPRLKALSLSMEDELEKISEPSHYVQQRRYSSVQDLLESETKDGRLQDNQPDLLIGTANMDESVDLDEIVLCQLHPCTSALPAQLSKKRTFLQKITLKAGWTSSKRKTSSKLMNKHTLEITPSDFRETYTPRTPSAESPCSAPAKEVISMTASRSRSSGSSSSSEACGQKIKMRKQPAPPALDVRELPEINQPSVAVQIAEQTVPDEPPPPIPLTTQRLGKSTLAEIKSGHLQHHHIESMSVTTSEDSGIVARPSSSASKSDSLLSSRPDSSSSSVFKGFSLRLTASELVNASGRISPSTSDFSKAESCRMLDKIEETRMCEDDGTTQLAVRLKQDKILETGPHMLSEADTNLARDYLTVEEKINSGSSKTKSDKAWYDLSDEEPDLLSSASRHITGRLSSDEEVSV